MSNPRRTAWLERFTQRSDLVMTLLGIAWIPVLELPILTHVPASMHSTFFVLDSVVWVLFILEYLVKLYLAPSRTHFMRTHLIELLVIGLPLLRPLRVLRVLNLLSHARVGTLFWSVYARTHEGRWHRRLSLTVATECTLVSPLGCTPHGVVRPDERRSSLSRVFASC